MPIKVILSIDILLAIAIKNNFRHLFDYALKKHAKLTSTNLNNRTPLHLNDRTLRHLAAIQGNEYEQDLFKIACSNETYANLLRRIGVSSRRDYEKSPSIHKNICEQKRLPIPQVSTKKQTYNTFTEESCGDLVVLDMGIDKSIYDLNFYKKNLQFNSKGTKL